jgi:RES domain-containing protein
MSLPETTPPRIWLEPMLLPSCVSYRADLGPIFDARDARALGHYGLSAATLADPGWRSTMLEGRPAPTQEFARMLLADGFAGLITRSFARGASASSLNLVLWRWAGDGCSLQVVDDEGRLGRM